MVITTQNPTIQAEEEGIRLDRWFKRHWPHLSHAYLEKMLRTGQVRLDGRRIKSNERLRAGQVLRLPPLALLETPSSKAPTPSVSAKKLPTFNLEVLYQDEDILVINKPSGLATQGGTKIDFSLDDLTSSLALPGHNKPKLVHRLDKETSGVLLLARTYEAAAFLAEAFRSRKIEKRYWAVVAGSVEKQEGILKAPLLRKTIGRQEKVMVDFNEGEFAESSFEVKAREGTLVTWLELSPKTGRTHQLRVHSAYLGHPIIGDGKYGARQAFPLGRPCDLHLHARQLIIPHPRGKKNLSFTAPLPSHMQQTWKKFNWNEHD